MAKDGTVRGGARAGAGRKSKALADKIIEGKAELDNGLSFYQNLQALKVSICHR